VWFVLAKLVWPPERAFFYRRWDVPVELADWIGYLGAAVAVTIGLWALRRPARGPFATWLVLGGALFPALGFFNVYPFLFSYVADHFHYLAAAGMADAARAHWERALEIEPLFEEAHRNLQRLEQMER
jgi:hypothetical protein